MLTSKSFPPQKKDAQKVSFPQKKGHQSLGPLWLFAPRCLPPLAFPPFPWRVQAVAAEPELAASRALGPPDSPGPCRPEESGHDSFRDSFWWVFLRGVGGWGASFESKCTSKFREFLGNTFPKKNKISYRDINWEGICTFPEGCLKNMGDV